MRRGGDLAATCPGDDAADARWVPPSELETLGVSAAARAIVSLGPARAGAESRDGGLRRQRTTHTCPKCKNPEVLFLPQIADRDDNDTVRPLSAHVVHFDWKDDVEVGKLQAYVCRKCGFTEIYTKEASQLPWQKIPGAKLLTPNDAVIRSMKPPPSLSVQPLRPVRLFRIAVLFRPPAPGTWTPSWRSSLGCRLHGARACLARPFGGRGARPLCARPGECGVALQANARRSITSASRDAFASRPADVHGGPRRASAWTS